MLVPSLDWPAIREREAGVRRALSRPGARARVDTVACGDTLLRDTQEALGGYLDRNALPDAVVAGNDQMGIAAMKLLRQRGVRVPGRVLVTGFNAFDFWQYSDPVLTSVRSPAYDIGARGAAAMLERLRAGRFGTRDIVLPVELQLGGST
jgi:LacI family transcriptional regulator